MFGDLFDRAFTRRNVMRAAGAGLVVPIAAAAPMVAAAQNATPPSGTCPGATPLGTKVTFLSVDGSEVGQISVDEVTDPFTGYRPNQPPPRGNRFVTLTVTVTNTGSQPWSFEPYAVTVQDSDGFLLRPAGVDLGEKPSVPALTGQSIDAGATVKGVVGYTAIKGTTLSRVFFTPTGDRLLLLADIEPAGRA